MATVNISQPFTFLAAQDWAWDVVGTPTSTTLTISDGTHRMTFNGSFTYPDDNTVNGTVTATYYYVSGSLVFSVTGMSSDAHQLQIYAETPGDTQETFAYVLSGNDTINGSSGNDVLVGYNGNDILKGNGGSDVLYGYAGTDTLYGGIGKDVLNGGAGADTMRGNAGNDVYYVDNTSDKAIELSGEGSDLVKSNVTFTLGANVEALTLTGASAINGYGNGLANSMTGNNAANTLAGNLGNDVLRGNGGNDILNGGGGSDNLIGGAGKDNLTGGTGVDSFVFNSALGPGNVDTIKDYTRADDVIRLENSIFTSLSTTGPLNANNFKVGINAADANDFIIYNNVTGALYYDADGSGAGSKVLIANVFSSGTTAASLSAGEFVVI